MSKRRRVLLGTGLLMTVAFAGFLALPLLIAWTQRITEENYHKVHADLRRSDVEALLGPPAGDRNVAFSFLFLCTNDGRLHDEYEPYEAFDDASVWGERGRYIVVGFRSSCTVAFKRYEPGQPETLLALIRRWLRI